MSPRAKNFARSLVGVGVLIALFVFFDLRAVLAALSQIRLVDLSILLGLSVLLILVSVLKWQAFLERLGIRHSIGYLFKLYLVGYFVNLIMPSSLGGDFVRSVHAGAARDKVRAFSATMLERYTGLVAMVGMAVVSLAWAPQVTVEIRILTACLALGLIVCSFAIGSGLFVWALRTVRFPAWLVERAERLRSGLVWGLSDRPLLVKAAILSLLFHLLTVLNTAAVAHAVGWSGVPYLDLLVVVPLILLVGAVPISPNGLGIQEGAFLYFLHLVGASTPQALAIALVLRAKSYVLALCGGVCWLSLRGSTIDVEPDVSSV